MAIKEFFRSPKAPFEKLLGLNILKVTQDFARVKLPFNTDFTNPHNSLHGGAIVSLADTAAAVALSTRFENAEFFTIRFNIEFKKQAKSDIFAEARIIRKRRNLYSIDIKIFDEDKELVAQAETTFFVPNSK
jgi:acyl-CoA thioesterase